MLLDAYCFSFTGMLTHILQWFEAKNRLMTACINLSWTGQPAKDQFRPRTASNSYFIRFDINKGITKLQIIA